jgi:hypothetical protein
MLRRTQPPPFLATDPLGLPRPVDVDNIFGARPQFFRENKMPVPTGCLEHFDRAVYRPYLRGVAEALAARERGWFGPVVMGVPPRYLLLRDWVPAEIPEELAALLPPPPRVPLRDLLGHFEKAYPQSRPRQLLDVLALIREDLGPLKFGLAVAGHPWVAEVLS